MTPIEQTWHAAVAKAGTASIREGDYVVFRVDESSTRGIYGGVDSEGCLLLAIEVGCLPPLIEIRSTALDYFRQERKGLGAWLMVIRLRRVELAPVFGRLCQDVIDEIHSISGDEALLGVLRKRISLWQRLFEDGGTGLLADFQAKGLIAELLFMEAQFGERDPLEIASGWQGPSGGDQDFIFSDAAVEIKAIGPNAEGVSISSLEQLQSVLPLHLSVWTLRPASPAEASAVTLNDLVARIEQKFAPHPTALGLFRGALLEAGYVVHPRYSEIAFEALRVEQFLVDESFPRLTSLSVPDGIAAATYVVSLTGIRTNA